MYVSEDQPARFIEEDGFVYTFIGKLASDENGGKKVISSKRIEHKIDDDAFTLIEFVKTPRTEKTIERFLEASGNKTRLESLVEEGIVLQVDTRNVYLALDRFNGVRIIPLSVAGGNPSDQPSLVEVKKSESEPVAGFVTTELSRILWGEENELHIYKAVKKISKETGVDRKLVARRVLTNIPQLLTQDLARLEWQDDSETNMFAKLGKALFGSKA